MRNLFMLFKKLRMTRWNTFMCQLIEIVPEATFLEDISNHPIINFKISDKTFKIYSSENFLKRTKFCCEFSTFLKISAIDESEVDILRKRVDEIVNCNVLTKKTSIIINISRTHKLDKVIKFIEEQKNTIL
jgi:hypothetical protein